MPHAECDLTKHHHIAFLGHPTVSPEHKHNLYQSTAVPTLSEEAGAAASAAMLLPGMRLGSLSQRVMTGGAAVMGISVLIRRQQHKPQSEQAVQALAAPVPPDSHTQLYSRLSEPYSYSMAAATASGKGSLGISLARGSSIVAFCLLTVALGCLAALPAVVSVSASAWLATAVSRLLPEVSRKYAGST